MHDNTENTSKNSFKEIGQLIWLFEIELVLFYEGYAYLINFILFIDLLEQLLPHNYLLKKSQTDYKDFRSMFGVFLVKYTFCKLDYLFNYLLGGNQIISAFVVVAHYFQEFEPFILIEK